MSPTITAINIGGFRFFFGSKEGDVPHVHVKTRSGVIKWWIGKDGDRVVSLKHDPGVTSADFRKSKRLVERHYDVILDFWRTYFATHEENRTAAQHRDTTPIAYVQVITQTGFWFFLANELYWIDYEDFPVFADAAPDEIKNFEIYGNEDFHWPDLDVDIELESLLFPERFPLRARTLPPK